MNYQIFKLVNSAAGHWAALDRVMLFSAVDLVFLVLSLGGALVIYALTQRQVRAVLGAGAALVLSFGLAAVLAHISRQVRPAQAHAVHELIRQAPGASMPSEYATAAFAVAFAVLVFLSRPVGIGLTTAAVLIGLGEVWTGVHYPGDILAGAGIAGLSTLSVYVIGRGPYATEVPDDLLEAVR